MLMKKDATIDVPELYSIRYALTIASRIFHAAAEGICVSGIPIGDGFKSGPISCLSKKAG